MSEPIRAILFDLDGTLIDTEPYYVRSWQEAGQALGLPMTRTQGLQLRSLGAPYNAYFIRRLYGPAVSYQALREKRVVLMGDVLETASIPLKPGARALLDFLHTRQVELALVTANAPEKAQRMLARFGLEGDFDRVISARDVPRGKPAPDVYRCACEALGLPPEQCVAVEDSPNGIISAFGAGCRPVLVPDQSEAEDCLQPLLWACVERLDQLIPLLEGELPPRQLEGVTP
ncbi:MAG: HAD family phosphatase [Clostridiales bacterium]|nr:HAD family phosphatase [Clostridiales bacterium]